MFFCAHPRFPNTLITSQAPSSWIQYLPWQYWLLPGGKTIFWKHFDVIVYKDFFALGQKLENAQTCQQFSSPPCLEDPPPHVAQTVGLLLFFSSRFCGSRWLVALIQFSQKAANDLKFSLYSFFEGLFPFYCKLLWPKRTRNKRGSKMPISPKLLLSLYFPQIHIPLGRRFYFAF